MQSICKSMNKYAETELKKHFQRRVNKNPMCDFDMEDQAHFSLHCEGYFLEQGRTISICKKIQGSLDY